MPKRILIVDDEPKILELFSRILKSENYEIRTALNGKTALQLVADQAFDLIVLDLKMPGLNGAQTLQGIRQTDQAVPVYLVTAFQNEFVDDLKAMQQAGVAFEILDKPVEKKVLLLAVDSALSGPLKV